MVSIDFRDILSPSLLPRRLCQGAGRGRLVGDWSRSLRRLSAQGQGVERAPRLAQAAARKPGERVSICQRFLLIYVRKSHTTDTHKKRQTVFRQRYTLVRLSQKISCPPHSYSVSWKLTEFCLCGFLLPPKIGTECRGHDTWAISAQDVRNRSRASNSAIW